MNGKAKRKMITHKKGYCLIDVLMNKVRKRKNKIYSALLYEV